MLHLINYLNRHFFLFLSVFPLSSLSSAIIIASTLFLPHYTLYYTLISHLTIVITFFFTLLLSFFLTRFHLHILFQGLQNSKIYCFIFRIPVIFHANSFKFLTINSFVPSICFFPRGITTPKCIFFFFNSFSASLHKHTLFSFLFSCIPLGLSSCFFLVFYFKSFHDFCCIFWNKAFWIIVIIEHFIFSSQFKKIFHKCLI